MLPTLCATVPDHTCWNTTVKKIFFSMLFAIVFFIYCQAKYTTPVTTHWGESVYGILLLLSIIRTAPKVIPPTVLHLSTMSEAESTGMTVEVELSHQYSTTFYYHVTNGSRGAN